MNTARVITSCMILSCASERTVNPMRLAGTCKRYSNSAMPQEMSAAAHHGLPEKFLRCPYHANVMKRFDSVRSTAADSAGCEAATAVRFMTDIRGSADYRLLPAREVLPCDV